VRESNNLPSLEPDEILNNSARDYLIYFIDKYGTDFRDTGDLLDSEIQKKILTDNLFTGVSSSLYSELYITDNPKKIYQLLKDNTKTRKREYNRFGISVIEYKNIYYSFFSFRDKAAEIKLETNRFQLFDRFYFEVEVIKPEKYRDPSVFVTLPDGIVTEIKPIRVIGKTFTVDFDRFRDTGIYTFEIVMETDRGPEPTNIFKVMVGAVEETEKYTHEDKAKVKDSIFPEETMLKLINRDRSKMNLPDLKMINEVNRIAEKHSKEMAEEGEINHVSRLTGDVSDRIKDWKDYNMFFISKLGENLSKAKDVHSSQKGLMESPGHRGNILDPDFNSVGIGIAKGKDGYLYITQIFLQINEFPEADSILENIFSSINRKRKTQDSSLITRDSILNEMSALLLEKAVTIGYDAFSRDFQGNVNEVMIDKGYEGNLNFLVFTFTDFTEIIDSPEFYRPESSKIGIAVKKNLKEKNYLAIIILE